MHICSHKYITVLPLPKNNLTLPPQPYPAKGAKYASAELGLRDKRHDDKNNKDYD